MSYQLTDHLGNVRAVVTKQVGSSNPPTMTSYADYYPFGEQLPGRNSMSGYRYAFQGQELDTELGMEAFQLRLWDGRIGRWLSPDPYGQYASPYLGMGNNPIGMIDPDGGETNDWYRNNITGGYTWYDSSDAIDGFTHLGVDFFEWNPITLDYSYAFDKNTVFDSSGSAIAFNLGGLKDVVVNMPKRSGGNFGDFNINNAVATLNSKAYATHDLVPKSQRGACARYVRYAVEDGFGLPRDRLTTLNPRSPIPARDWGQFLEKKGFTKLSTIDYKKGDIVVMQGYPGGSSDENGVPWGHIAMNNGKQWVSYWNQNSIYANSKYRLHNPTHFIYRWNN